MEISVFENVLSIVLPERMSIDNAEDCTRIIDDALREHPGCSLRFDAEKLTYISSMGLRVLLHSIKKTEGRIPIENVSHDVYSIFQTTGFTSLMDVRLRPRDLSVEGCELIGSGRSSHVYRLDSETIIKCYEPTIPLNRIRHEMDLARNSFIKGIPTAIPMELVRVGDRYGAVFELIDADTVGHHVSEHPEDFEKIAVQFTGLLKQIHETHMDTDSGFSSEKDTWMGWLEGMKDYYTEDEYCFMKDMLDEVPERDTLIHCDYHENNVLYQNGELILIDMADIGYGHPIFDLAGMACRSHLSFIPGRKAHHGLVPNDMKRFYETELRCYFDIKDGEHERFEAVKELCDAFGYLRSALFPMKHRGISQELLEIHLADARKFLLNDERETTKEKLKGLKDFF